MLLLSQTQVRAIFDKSMGELAARKFDAALKGFRQVINADPSFAEAHFQAGRILIAGDQPKQALRFLRQAAELKPNVPSFWQIWSEAVALAGDEEAEKEFLAALAKAPIAGADKTAIQERFGALRKSSRPKTGGLQPKVMQAMVAAMKSRNFAEGARLASNALLKHPQSAFAANILATAQAATGNTAAAHASYRKALEIDPRYAEAYDNFGRMLLDENKLTEAENHLKKAVILAPGMVSALLNLGDVLTRSGHQAQALTLLERAEKADPKSATIQVAMANAYMRSHNYEKAEQAFEKADKLSDGRLSVSVRTSFAASKSRLAKDDEALEILSDVLEKEPDFPAALSSMGSLLQTQGDFEKARAYLARAMEKDPSNGENYRVFVASQKAKADDPILPKMLEIFENAPLEDTDRMNLAFAIAKVLEDIKDNDRIFKYLDVANALMRKSAPYFIDKRYREVRQYKEAYADFDFLGTRIEGATDYAPIFVTGMPRSGTTLVEQIISSHSKVSGGGELAKASVETQKMMTAANGLRKLADVQAGELVDLGNTIATYLHNLYPETPHVTDKAIQTYMHIGALRLAMPNARFILVRRDPRDNLLSMYKNKFPEGTHLHAYDQRDLARYYGTFVEMVEFWREKVPGWFYEVSYEELVANPEPETRKLIEACGLEWEDQCLSSHENKRKVQTLSVYQVRQPISGGSVKGWKRHEKDLAPMLDELRKLGLVAD